MMSPQVSAILGIVFVVLGFATVFLMFHLWGYPFDKVTRKSEAPRGLMILHRVLGFAYAAIYVVMMTQMLPRMWTYQIEFPPRTVAHIVLGLTIGFILIVKISIVRFFRHLEEWMPFLGTGLLLCTVLLLGLSLPFTLKEQRLAQKTAAGGDVYSAQNVERLKRLLPAAEFPKEANLDELAKVDTLKLGRKTLLSKCVECHDLKTVLSRPRSPSDWLHTIERMGDKPALTDLTQKEQWATASYLIAISPELQASAQKKREQELEAKKAKAAAVSALKGDKEDVAYDEAAAKKLVADKCVGCHELDELEKHPPKTKKDVSNLLGRMVDNGLEAEEKELSLLGAYLTKTYAKE